MTGIEKKRINSMRYARESYKSISKMLSIKESTVKSYCSRNHLTDKDITLQTNIKEACCQQCGAHLEQKAKSKPRRFCSDTCRIKWWNEHRQLKQHKNPQLIKCSGCGAAVLIYGSQHRKYCSHECYIASRYGSRGA